MSIKTGVKSALCFLLLCHVALAVEPTEPLRLASDVWPPFTDVEGRPRVAIDLVQEALRRTGITANSEIGTDFANIIESLRSGEFDGSASLWFSPERDSFLLFSRPYLENRLVVVGRTGSDVSASKLDELDGKKVAVVENYAYGEVVKKADGPHFVNGASDGKNLQALLRADVDYVLIDELVLHHLFTHHPSKAKSLLEVGTRPLAVRSLHFAMRRDHPEAERIVTAFNAEIRRMLIDGSYNKTLQIDWIQADVDGDGKLELVLGSRAAGDMPPTSGYEVFAIEPADGLMERLQVSYFIAGQKYDDWEKVPAEYKIPPKHAIEPGMQTGHPGLLLFEF